MTTDKGGQPTKLTPTLQRAFMKVIKASGFYRDACIAVGISEETLSRWREWGAQGRDPFRGFCEALLKAESERRLSYLAESKKRGARKNDPREVHWRAAVTDPKVFSIKHHEIVREELEAACQRVAEEFMDEPEICERVFSALAAEPPALRRRAYPRALAQFEGGGDVT